ncbi:MAG: cytochrome c biogenesis protein CcsA [Candidatus Thorarchaeota archaeon]
MDFGTILLVVAAVVGIVDILIMLIGPRIPEYESLSFGMSIIAAISAIGALLWMTSLIFSNQFQYEYVSVTTTSSSDLLLKISAIWAGQSGSLLFWTMLSFLLYFGFRIASRGYEDDKIVYRASIIMGIQAIIVGLNAIAADPFRLIEGATPTEGFGLNPLLRTFWNAVHPPIVFIAYALIMVPFAIRLAGFTVRTEERNTEKIPMMESLVNLTTVVAWVMLSLGIVIGGYWAYIVLGWGGFWAWDPVETGSLIPWLLLTGYYHAKPIFRKNDVLRDSFLVFAYITVLFATWVTRSGVLNSVHGFLISTVSWTMLATLVSNFVVAAIISMWSGYRDIEDEEEDVTEDDVVEKMAEGILKSKNSNSIEPVDENTEISNTEQVDYSNIISRISSYATREFSIKLALLGILVITSISVIGILLPATINMMSILANPTAPNENLVTVGEEFFWIGFYGGSFFLMTSAFFCMDTSLISKGRRFVLIVILVIIGAILGGISFYDPSFFLPTPAWMVNLLVPLAVGALAYLLVVFVRYMAGKEKGPFTMRKMGRVMLHMGMLILIFGVFMSENAVYETTDLYLEGDSKLITPTIWIEVEDIDLHYFYDETNFYITCTILVAEGENLVGIGFINIQGHPEYGSATHQVYIQSSAFRDVFIAMVGFSQPLPNTLAVSIHTKILPFVTFVWIGAFFMVAAMLPMVGLELTNLRKARFAKKQEFAEDELQEEDIEQ